MQNANNDFYFKFQLGNQINYFDLTAIENYCTSGKTEQYYFLVKHYPLHSAKDLVFIKKRFRKELGIQIENYAGEENLNYNRSSYYNKPISKQ